MKKILRKILVLFLTIIAVVGITISVENGKNFFQMIKFENSNNSELYGGINSWYSTNSVVWIILFIFMINLINQNLKQKCDKKLMIYSLILSTLFSIFQIIGNCMNSAQTIGIIGQYWMAFLIKFIGSTVMFYFIIYEMMKSFSHNKLTENTKEFNFFTGNLRSIIIVMLLIFICWMPYFLKYYPGILQFDSIYQIKQGIGEAELTQQHPLIHTFLIKLCVNIGRKCFGTMNAGVAVYSIFQMLTMSLIFSGIIYYLAKKNIDTKIRFLVFLYFAFWPMFPIMAVSMLKDSIFCALLPIVSIIILEIIINTENFFKSWKRLIFSLIIITLFCLFRGNAVYGYILTIPFIAIYRKKYWDKILIFTVIPVIIFIIYSIIINYCLKIYNPDSIAFYSVPLQQITRTLIDNKENMSEEEKSSIYKFFKSNKYEEQYTIFLSDNLKVNCNIDYLNNNKGEFIALWFKLLFKYPKSYLDAFFGMVSGYFDISETRQSIWFGVYVNELGIESKCIYNSYLGRFVENVVYNQNIPIIGLIYNCALSLIILITMLFYNMYKKQYENIIGFLIIYMYILTTLLGPLNNEYRYIFFEYICIPIVIIFSLKNKCQKNLIDSSQF